MLAVDDSTSHVQCVIADGIWQARRIALDQYLASRALVEIWHPLKLKPRFAAMFHHGQSHLSPAIHIFVHWFREPFPSLRSTQPSSPTSLTGKKDPPAGEPFLGH